MKRYDEYLKALEAARTAAVEIPLGKYRPINWGKKLVSGGPVAMLFFAHPDDEWLSGMPLGLRLRRDGYRLVNVPVTLGRPEQYERRLKELSNACRYAGMHMEVPGKDGKGLRDQIKGENGGQFVDGIYELWAMIRKYSPSVVITHHENDGHHDHKAVSRMVREALAEARQSCFLAETEFWNDLDPPGFQLEFSRADMARILRGVSFHIGEVGRNPYHLTFPLLAMLNGQYAERVTGWGKPAAPFQYSVMLKLSEVNSGMIAPYNHPKQVSARGDIGDLFPPF